MFSPGIEDLKPTLSRLFRIRIPLETPLPVSVRRLAPCQKPSARSAVAFARVIVSQISARAPKICDMTHHRPNGSKRPAPPLCRPEVRKDPGRWYTEINHPNRGKAATCRYTRTVEPVGVDHLKWVWQFPRRRQGPKGSAIAMQVLRRTRNGHERPRHDRTKRDREGERERESRTLCLHSYHTVVPK